jgi:hypothetical protein
VTYVNHIVAGEGWNSLSEFDKVFTCWNQPSLPCPGRPDGIAFQVRFPITGPDGKWIGRLHVDVQPALRLPDTRPMFVMNLTARGMTGSNFDFFDIGRQWVVNSFIKLTTDHMHNIWRKK